MKAAVIRKAHFNAAHRLYNKAWSDEKNNQVFGLCNNLNFHGHNYELEVKVVGEIDPSTRFVIDTKKLKDIIFEQVEQRLDHKNLNLDVEYFHDLNPTAENICYVIWTLLRAQLDPSLELFIRLYETPRNIVEFPA